MAILKKSSAASYHFYTRDGKPMHRMPLADGTGERPTHMGDAKKLGLLPSVSAVLNLLSKEGLNKWKLKQVALKAITLAKKPEESDEYYADRLIDSALQQVDDAAKLGSEIHAEIERFFTWDGKSAFVPNEKVSTYVRPVVNWILAKKIQIVEAEAVVVNALHGFAGTSDAPFRWNDGKGIGVIDFKSRKTKPGEPVENYDGQPMQIAAYAATYWGEEALQACIGANVYISTTEPGRVDVISYTPQQLQAEWQCFLSLAHVFRHVNQWDPRVPITQPQPPFYNGKYIPITPPALNQVGQSSPQVPTSQPSPIPASVPTAPPPPPPQVEPSNIIKFPEGTTFLSLLQQASLDLVCDGIKFLRPEVCCDISRSGKTDTIYMWYYHPTENKGRVSIRNDAALLEHGWRSAFFAFPADIDNVDKAAGRTGPEVGTNGLPVKPADGTNTSKGIDFAKKAKESREKKASDPKKKSKIDDQARVVVLENSVIEFGVHKHKKVKDVPDDYLVWLSKQSSVLARDPLLSEYLSRSDVRKALKLEALT